jgi:beta-lactamase regulating signal transducer with metallopeptidase domain
MLRLLGVARPRARYALSLAALCAMTLGAVATGILLRPPQRPVPDSAVPDRALVPVAVHGVDLHFMPSLPQPLPSQPFWTEQRIMPWLVAGWSAGVLMLSLWQVGGWLILRNHRRSGLPVDPAWQERVDRLSGMMRIAHRVGLAATKRLDVPIVIGVIMPMILIPLSMLSELSPQQVEAILAHELAHVQRYDYLVNLIQCGIETVFFYHPAVWWISKQIRREREFCCDELAASACGDRRGYARALAALEESRVSLRLAPAAIRSRGELLVRVQRLLDPPASSTHRERNRSGLIAILLLATCVTLPLMSHRSSAQFAALTTAPYAGPVNSPVTPEDLAKPAPRAYQIGKNDMVQISIMGLVQQGVETQVVRRVSQGGGVSVPMVGQVNVEDLSESQAELAIAKAYADAQLIAQPQVKVVVVEARNWTFSIIGDVPAAGEYAIVDVNFRLLDALALARDDVRGKGKTIRVTRPTADPAKPRLIEISGDALNADPQRWNIVISPKDVIQVARASAPSTQPLADEHAALQAQVAAQQALVDALKQRQEAGEALTPTFVQLMLDAQMRLTEAKFEAAADELARGAAYQRLLAAQEQLRDVLQKRLGQDVTRVQLSQVEAALSSTRAAIASLRRISANVPEYRAKLIDAQIKLTDVQSQYGPNHPSVLLAQRQLQNAQKQYDQALAELRGEPATTQPARNLKSFDIVVKQGQILHDGNPTEWAAVRKELEAIPPDERKNLLLALSAGSAALQVRDYFQAQAEASKIVKDLGLAYLSDTGMAPNAEDVQAGHTDH